VVRVCAGVRSFMRNCTKLFGTDFSGCWREALVLRSCRGSCIDVMNIHMSMSLSIANCNLLLLEPEVSVLRVVLFEHVSQKMSDFSSSLPGDGSKLDSSQKEQLMEQVKAQIAVANAQELLQVSSNAIHSD